MTLAESYARGLYEAGKAAPASSHHKLFAALLAALKRRGHEKLLPRIGREYKKLALRAEKNTIRIRIAHRNDASAAHKKAAELDANAQNIEAHIDESLVSGFLIEGPDFRFDASGRRALIELYQRLTAAH